MEDNRRILKILTGKASIAQASTLKQFDKGCCNILAWIADWYRSFLFNSGSYWILLNHASSKEGVNEYDADTSEQPHAVTMSEMF